MSEEISTAENLDLKAVRRLLRQDELSLEQFTWLFCQLRPCVMALSQALNQLHHWRRDNLVFHLDRHVIGCLQCGIEWGENEPEPSHSPDCKIQQIYNLREAIKA